MVRELVSLREEAQVQPEAREAADRKARRWSPSSGASGLNLLSGSPATLGAMSADDPIRALLASLSPSSMIRTPPGYVAITRERVEEADGNAEAVREWVEAYGGYMDQTAPVVSRSLGPRYGREYPGTDFYAVPRRALSY